MGFPKVIIIKFIGEGANLALGWELTPNIFCRAPRDVSLDFKSRPPPLCEILNTPLGGGGGPTPQLVDAMQVFLRATPTLVYM